MESNVNRTTSAPVWDILSRIEDPEVPVISIVDLGIVRDVEVADESVRVKITPTYSGCPAMRMIEDSILAALKSEGYREVRIETVFFPPWTTDWIGEEAKRKLKEYGIAPPGKVAGGTLHTPSGKPSCPFCDSPDTRLQSEFGSTPCKALFTCNACRQPFEHFKCL